MQESSLKSYRERRRAVFYAFEDARKILVSVNKMATHIKRIIR
jgi:hypothetical protein